MKVFITTLALIVTVQLNAQVPDTLWTNVLGGSADECPGYGFDYKVKMDVNDNGESFIISGTVSDDHMVDTNYGSADCYIVKLDDVGDTLWTKVIGGSNADLPQDIYALADGGCLIAGFTYSDDNHFSGSHGASGEEDGFIGRLDSDGNVLWLECYGGSEVWGIPGRDKIYDIIVNDNGNILAVGQTNSQNGDLSSCFDLSMFYVGWLMEVDVTDGEIIEIMKLAWTSHDEWNPNVLYKTIPISDGSGYYLYGESQHTMVGADKYWVIKVDTTYSVDWQNEYGCASQNTAYTAVSNNDGGLIISGLIFSSDGDVTEPYIGGYNDIWLAELDNTGSIINEKVVGGSETELAYELINREDGYLLAGFTRSTDYYGSGDTTTVADFWLLCFDDQIDTLWTLKTGGTNSDILTDVNYKNDHIYITGRTESSDMLVTHNYGGKDIWVSKLTDPLVSIKETVIIDKLGLYPNPAQNYFVIEDDITNINKLRIHSITGELILSKDVILQQKVMINLKPGVYIVSMIKDGNLISSKLIVQ